MTHNFKKTLHNVSLHSFPGWAESGGHAMKLMAYVELPKDEMTPDDLQAHRQDQDMAIKLMQEMCNELIEQKKYAADTIDIYYNDDKFYAAFRFDMPKGKSSDASLDQAMKDMEEAYNNALRNPVLKNYARGGKKSAVGMSH